MMVQRSLYDKCPVCGGRKSKTAVTCRECLIKRRKEQNFRSPLPLKRGKANRGNKGGQGYGFSLNDLSEAEQKRYRRRRRRRDKFRPNRRRDVNANTDGA